MEKLIHLLSEQEAIPLQPINCHRESAKTLRPVMPRQDWRMPRRGGGRRRPLIITGGSAQVAFVVLLQSILESFHVSWCQMSVAYGGHNQVSDHGIGVSMDCNKA